MGISSRETRCVDGACGDGASNGELDTERERVATTARARGRAKGKGKDGQSRVWQGNGEGKWGSGAAAGGLDPATSRILTHLRATALHCEACPCIPNLCYINYEHCEKRVLRVASITSKQKNMGVEVTAGGFGPATSNKQVPAHLRIASPPREARPSFSNPCYISSTVRIRIGFITSIVVITRVIPWPMVTSQWLVMACTPRSSS